MLSKEAIQKKAEEFCPTLSFDHASTKEYCYQKQKDFITAATWANEQYRPLVDALECYFYCSNEESKVVAMKSIVQEFHKLKDTQ